MVLHRGTLCNILIFISLSLIAACGKSSSDAAPAVYEVAYLPSTGMNAPAQGKTTFQLKITKKSDGSPATGLSPSLTLTMHMTNGHTHATPVDSITESGTAGLYDCTVYYLMASGPGMGTWELNTMVDGETTTFYPSVAMAMGSDNVNATLYGADDIVTGMSGTSYNKYYIFRDGIVSSSMGTLNLYVSHSENMMMDFSAVSGGSVLSAPTGMINSMIVSASTDSTFVSGVATGIDDAHGHWTLPGLTGLVSAQTTTVYVKLNVNGQDKTTNGAAASGTNSYATFFVTPQ
jgi:hypothetical protein